MPRWRSVNWMRLQLFPDFPVLDFDGGLSATVHEEEQDGRAYRPGSEGLLDKDTADIDPHEEVEVGQDGHEKEGAAKHAVEPSPAFWTQIFLLK